MGCAVSTFSTATSVFAGTVHSPHASGIAVRGCQGVLKGAQFGPSCVEKQGLLLARAGADVELTDLEEDVCQAVLGLRVSCSPALVALVGSPCVAPERAPLRHPLVTVDPDCWAAKVRRLQQAGRNGAFLVLDFDRTMTGCFREGRSRSPDCHDILGSIPKITQACKRRMEEMMAHYYPIEIDSAMSIEEKTPHMVEWYNRVNELLAGEALTRDDVAHAVSSCEHLRLREGVEEVFQIAHNANIPIVVVSAGLGNIIEEVIRQRIRKPSGALGEPWSNVKVFSNTLLWDERGSHTGFSEPLVHMFNKSLKDVPASIRESLAGRHVGVLCGDGIGDLTMCTGHPTSEVLKVGFLNERVSERLHQFTDKDAYDQVVLNDGTFEPLLDVLRTL